MRILIVWPDVDSNARYELNLGICWIAAVLKQGGHKARLFHPRSFSAKSFLDEIKTHGPEVVAFSTTTNQYSYAIKYASLLKKHTNIPTVFGGFHPTLAPESVISSPYVDIVCRGEGEYPMLELVNTIEKGESFDNIPNLWVKKKDGTIVKNGIRPLNEDLDALPFPDREFFGQEEILDKNGGRFDVSIGRGCPFNCPYCCNSALREITRGKGTFLRFRSVDRVLKEIELSQKRYKIKEIHFQDDTFTCNKKWLSEFSKKFSEKLRIPFHISARVETIDSETVQLLKNAGCISITMGVETGNEELRKNILKRNMANKDFIRVFHMLKKAGIRTVALNMVGIPGETSATIKETIALNKLLDPNWMGVSIFNPYPLTALYDLCKEKDYLTTSSLEGYAPSYLDEDGYVLNLPTISKDELIKGYREFQDFTASKYIRDKYPWLYPVHILTSPLLKTPLRKVLINLAMKTFFDSGKFKRRLKKRVKSHD